MHFSLFFDATAVLHNLASQEACCYVVVANNFMKASSNTVISLAVNHVTLASCVARSCKTAVSQLQRKQLLCNLVGKEFWTWITCLNAMRIYICTPPTSAIRDKHIFMPRVITSTLFVV